jgi:hypothetical protein
MAIGRAQKPEEDLRGHQGAHVISCSRGLLQDREEFAQARAALVLVLHQRGRSGGLAEVLLGESPDVLAGDAPVEALYHQDVLLPE